jgi:predicted nucleotidyltransferase component of viral defense system
MKLHQNMALFKQAVKFTAAQKGILDIYIEKDYWVTFVLYNLYKSELGKEIVFKGGTALSKCYGIIDRFSYPK